jgi:RNA polymerase sigma-70 factor (ECF subfamily)
MGTGKTSNVMEPPVISLRSEERITDGQLLERFIFHRDETAFTDLVHRYGTLVLGVCQRVLGDSHQAEDAFQATFLVLVRKARILDRSGPLGNWLYAVAYRTATKARMVAARRRARERQAMYSTSEPFTVENQAWDELRPILDEELSQLPRKYRAPLVLCYLEGKTQQEAAQALGWPSGSMSRRMNRARQLLRDRLEKRGVANSISVGVLFWLLQQKATAGMVSSALAGSTVKAALACAAGETIMATAAATLAQDVIQAAAKSRRKVGYVVLAIILLLAVGGFVSAAWMYETARSAYSTMDKPIPPPPSVELPGDAVDPAAAAATQPAIQNLPSCHK